MPSRFQTPAPGLRLHLRLLNYCTKTERGSQIYEVKDKQGRVTHKYQEMDNGFAITAFIYNSLGFLSFVIPPEAYNKLGPGKITSFTENDVIFKELCFGYRQDKFGRIIEKPHERIFYSKNKRHIF